MPCKSNLTFSFIVVRTDHACGICADITGSSVAEACVMVEADHGHVSDFCRFWRHTAICHSFERRKCAILQCYIYLICLLYNLFYNMLIYVV